jgi:hypothetical protein
MLPCAADFFYQKKLPIDNEATKPSEKIAKGPMK